ncbi:hypothetical protein GALMADRAFT_212480 [Galerina marginata CBS 339.88]|uniref:Uncharacterized protein n=1 Tax=Galerina marginata (strain CBS 339.88) TaxID=685588 RepID=A0A067T129_GALM3|nr:hypothetical protein GALMADRAFT_212480 [Galerina marginata CBS 339.88]
MPGHPSGKRKAEEQPSEEEVPQCGQQLKKWKQYSPPISSYIGQASEKGKSVASTPAELPHPIQRNIQIVAAQPANHGTSDRHDMLVEAGPFFGDAQVAKYLLKLLFQRKASDRQFIQQSLSVTTPIVRLNTQQAKEGGYRIATGVTLMMLVSFFGHISNIPGVLAIDEAEEIALVLAENEFATVLRSVSQCALASVRSKVQQNLPSGTPVGNVQGGLHNYPPALQRVPSSVHSLDGTGTPVMLNPYAVHVAANNPFRPQMPLPCRAIYPQPTSLPPPNPLPQFIARYQHHRNPSTTGVPPQPPYLPQFRAMQATRFMPSTAEQSLVQGTSSVSNSMPSGSAISSSPLNAPATSALPFVNPFQMLPEQADKRPKAEAAATAFLWNQPPSSYHIGFAGHPGQPLTIPKVSQAQFAEHQSQVAAPLSSEPAAVSHRDASVGDWQNSQLPQNYSSDHPHSFTVGQPCATPNDTLVASPEQPLQQLPPATEVKLDCKIGEPSNPHQLHDVAFQQDAQSMTEGNDEARTSYTQANATNAMGDTPSAESVQDTESEADELLSWDSLANLFGASGPSTLEGPSQVDSLEEQLNWEQLFNLPDLKPEALNSVFSNLH